METKQFKCELCGHQSDEFFVFRSIWLDNNAELLEGFKTHLTIDEKYDLKKKGKTLEWVTICQNRSRCQNKQIKQGF